MKKKDRTEKKNTSFLRKRRSLYGCRIKAFRHNSFNNLLTLLTLIMFIAFQRVTAQLNSKQVFNEVKFDQKLNSQVPLDLSFRDEAGKQVRLRNYFQGKPVVLSLVYYECPMLCTQVLNGMDQAFNSLRMSIGKEYDVVTVSINPTETPDLAADKKKEYLRMYGNRPGSDEGWHFLTGEKPQIDSLADAVGFHYLYDAKTDVYAHPSGIMVLTPDGKVSRYLFGVEYQPKDLRFSLIDASSRKIGSPADQLLLLCYHYDPSTGKYGLVIANVFRIAGAVTIVVLGTVLLVFFRQEKKRSSNIEMQQKT